MSAAHRAGRAGAVTELAFFFKDPVATGEHALAAQYETFRSWALGL
ncbi:hypothetical protein ACTWPT_53655 [Nonomuraea sp. 3N208]